MQAFFLMHWIDSIPFIAAAHKVDTCRHRVRASDHLQDHSRMMTSCFLLYGKLSRWWCHERVSRQACLPVRLIGKSRGCTGAGNVPGLGFGSSLICGVANKQRSSAMEKRIRGFPKRVRVKGLTMCARVSVLADLLAPGGAVLALINFLAGVAIPCQPEPWPSPTQPDQTLLTLKGAS